LGLCGDQIEGKRWRRFVGPTKHPLLKGKRGFRNKSSKSQGTINGKGIA